MKNSRKEKVYSALGLIPRGRVSTYREVSLYAGVGGARGAASIISKNPRMVEVPCHRVVKSSGQIGGYSGKGGVKEKMRLLKKEGVETEKGKVKNFKSILYKFKDES